MAPSSSHGERSNRQPRTNPRAPQTRYRRLYDELLAILLQLDPLGVHEMDKSALAPEVASIMARLHEARFADDVERIVVEELHRWYGRRRLTRIDGDRLADATIAICTVWNRFLAD